MSKTAPTLYGQHSSVARACQLRACVCPTLRALLSPNAFVAFVVHVIKRLTSTGLTALLPAELIAMDLSGLREPLCGLLPLPRDDTRKVALPHSCALLRHPSLDHGSASCRAPSAAGGV